MTTEITFIPCRADFENDIATRFVVDIDYTNEFEQHLRSARRPSTAGRTSARRSWASRTLGWTFQRTRINPSRQRPLHRWRRRPHQHALSNDLACDPAGSVACAPRPPACWRSSRSSTTPTSRSPRLCRPAAMRPTPSRSTTTTITSSVSAGSCRGALTHQVHRRQRMPGSGICRISGAPCTVAGGGCRGRRFLRPVHERRDPLPTGCRRCRSRERAMRISREGEWRC